LDRSGTHFAIESALSFDTIENEAILANLHLWEVAFASS
jgi:hypothetical protein